MPLRGTADIAQRLAIEEPAVIARILAHLEKTAGEESRPELHHWQHARRPRSRH